MAEQIRSYEDIVKELFIMRENAVYKLRKVRHTLWEISLWKSYGYNLGEINAECRKYFEKRFLDGQTLTGASQDVIEKGLEKLYYAVGILDDGTYSGCYRRCLRLLEELNEALKVRGLRVIVKPKKFLDWLTFDYDVIKDYCERPVLDRGAEIRIFKDEVNFKMFADLLKFALRYNRAAPMQRIANLMFDLENDSVSL